MNRKVLVVDSRPEIIDEVSICLHDNDLDIFVAHNGMQALEVIESHDIEVIVTDYQIPFMLSFDLAHILQQKGKNIPYILYSPQEKNLNHQAFNFEGKPILSFHELKGLCQRRFKSNQSENHSFPIILVEDDKEDVHLLIEEELKGSNAKIIHSFTGKELLDDYIEIHKMGHKVDMILVDLDLEDEDVHNTCKKLRQWEESADFNGTPIIALTALKNEKALDSCNASDGIDGYICRPVIKKKEKSVIIPWV